MPTRSTTAPASDDAVRTRAYLMWEADGRPFGNDAHYWNLALAELSAAAKPKRAAAAATTAPEKKTKATSKPVSKPEKAAKPKRT